MLAALGKAEPNPYHEWRPGRRYARDPSLIEPGALVIAGDEDAPAIAEVIDIVEKPVGKIVHLRILPGVIEDYEALIARAVTAAS